MKYDILNIITEEFHKFMRENPDWYDGVDWDDIFSLYRFQLQANAAAEKIELMIVGNSQSTKRCSLCKGTGKAIIDRGDDVSEYYKD